MNDEHADLSALLRGELTNDEATAAAEHTETCVSCRDNLLGTALGHGLLVASRRVLGPPPAADVDPPRGLPPALEREVRSRAPGRSRRVWTSVAALLVLVAGVGLGVGAGAVLGDRDGGENRAPAAAQSAVLEPVPGSGAPQATGRVSMGTTRGEVTRMRLDPETLPEARRGQFYYAWLFDPETDKMLPLGQVTPGHVATFDIPESLLASYSAIDVSLEADDGDPGHSVTSVLRATYAPPPVAPTQTS